ncbi:MAG TPA: ABC transporter substrate-binding protein [Stellaceae bacterium]|jgi:NitT/TauT family transport system substrate-binding protein|nr:ABC transporter substrate-binding protein [Stellaceae bacterium]
MTPRLTKRGLLMLGAMLTLGMAMPGMLRPAHADNLTPFKIAVSTPVSSILPVYLAKAGGFYKKQGLDVSIISTEGGTRGVQVLMSGEIQAMHVGLSPVVAANAQGADIRSIASTTNTLPITIFTTTKMNPPLPKGTIIGISTLGSETDIALTIALRAMGLKRSDMNITQIGGTSQRFAAMTVGRIQAAPMLEPGTTAAKQKGYTAVYDLSAAKTPWIFDSVVMTSAFLKAHPDEVQHFLKAYVEAAYWGMANPDKAKQVISTTFKTKDPAVIDASYNSFKSLMPLDARPSVEGAKNVIKELQATGVKLTTTDPNAYLDLGPIDQLKKSGFIAQMQKTYNIH